MIIKTGIDPTVFRIVKGPTLRIKRGQILNLVPKLNLDTRVKVVDIKMQGMKKFYIVEKAE